MDGEAILTVSAAVVALTQLAKWTGVPDERGPYLVLAIAALGVLVWIFAHGEPERGRAWEYFAGWVAIATSAAGVFGFTRAGADAVTRTRTPPPGAAQSPTRGARRP
jgi:hypothetical protein